MGGDATESTFSSSSAVAFTASPPPCDVVPIPSLSAGELLTHLVRVSQAVFHHLPVPPSASPVRPPAIASPSPSAESRKRRRDSVSSPPLPPSSAFGEAEEAAAVSAVCSWPLSPFLASAPSPALFHRLAVSPPPSSLAPRVAESLAALRALAVAHVARLRSAASPASVDRLAFFSSSLTALRSQQTAVHSALRLCRGRLRAEGRSTEATAKGRTAFASLLAALQAMKAELGLQSAEEAQAQESGRWVEGREGSSGLVRPTVGVHLASRGSSGCFVVEVELRREGATFADVLHSVRAEFLQGDAELKDAEVDAELRLLLASGRFALLRRKLSHLLSLEALSDRHPQRSLFSHRQPAEEAMRQLQQRTGQPLVVRSAVDGVALAFHHRHLPHAEATVDPLHLNAAPPTSHLHVPSHPSTAFTHCLTWIGLTEPLISFPLTSPPSASSPPPSFCPLFSVWPPIVVPSSSLQRLTRMGVSRHAQSGFSQSSHAPHAASAGPALSYHEAVMQGGLIPTSAVPMASDAGDDGQSPALPLLPPRLSVFGAVHEYRVMNDATAVESAQCVAYLSLHSLANLPDAVHLLRQSIVFQQLYASLFHPHPGCAAESDGSGDGAALPPEHRVEVTAFPPHSLRLRLPHPLQSGAALTVEVRVASVASVESCRAVHSTAASPPPAPFDCHLLTASIDRSFDTPFPCSDQFATDTLCATHSLPLLVHALNRRARQHQQRMQGSHMAPRQPQ